MCNCDLEALNEDSRLMFVSAIWHGHLKLPTLFVCILWQDLINNIDSQAHPPSSLRIQVTLIVVVIHHKLAFWSYRRVFIQNVQLQELEYASSGEMRGAGTCMIQAHSHKADGPSDGLQSTVDGTGGFPYELA